MSGKVTATSGEIGGWTIHSDKIFTGTDEDVNLYTGAVDRLIISSSGAIHSRQFVLKKDMYAAMLSTLFPQIKKANERDFIFLDILSEKSIKVW